jgi:hypothetical protein
MLTAKLVRGLIKEPFHILDQVIVITGEAASIFEGRADFLKRNT